MCMGIYVLVLWRPERSPGAGAIGVCGSPDLNALPEAKPLLITETPSARRRGLFMVRRREMIPDTAKEGSWACNLRCGERACREGKKKLLLFLDFDQSFIA